MENRNAQNIAERIAELLQIEEKRSDEFLRSSLEKLNQRLNQIESNPALENQESKVQNPKSNHSSQERFRDLEELAVEDINNRQNEKACPFEPTGKPCDDCAMCNSRGF